MSGPGEITYTTPNGLLAVLEFDCTLTERHDISAQITEHPIEAGTPITDFVKPNLRAVTIEACITNTPINEATIDGLYRVGDLRTAPATAFLATSSRRMVSGAQVSGPTVSPIKPPGFNTPAGAPSVTPARYATTPAAQGVEVLQAQAPQDRVQACFEELVFLCQTGNPVQLNTTKGFYPQMLIKSLSVPVDLKNAIVCTIEFIEYRTVTPQTVSIVRRKPQEKRAVPPAPQTPQSPDQEEIDAWTHEDEDLQQSLIDAHFRGALGSEQQENF